MCNVHQCWIRLSSCAWRQTENGLTEPACWHNTAQQLKVLLPHCRNFSTCLGAEYLSSKATEQKRVQHSHHSHAGCCQDQCAQQQQVLLPHSSCLRTQLAAQLGVQHPGHQPGEAAIRLGGGCSAVAGANVGEGRCGREHGRAAAQGLKQM